MPTLFQLIPVLPVQQQHQKELQHIKTTISTATVNAPTTAAKSKTSNNNSKTTTTFILTTIL